MARRGTEANADNRNDYTLRLEHALKTRTTPLPQKQQKNKTPVPPPAPRPKKPPRSPAASPPRATPRRRGRRRRRASPRPTPTPPPPRGRARGSASRRGPRRRNRADRARTSGRRCGARRQTSATSASPRTTAQLSRTGPRSRSAPATWSGADQTLWRPVFVTAASRRWRHWLISTLDQTSGAAGTAPAPASSAPVRRSGSRRWRTGGVKDGPWAPLDRPGTTPRKRQDAGAIQASRRDFDCHCQTTTCSAAPSRRRTRTATPASSAACSHWPRPRGSTTQRRQGAPSPAFRGRVDGVRGVAFEPVGAEERHDVVASHAEGDWRTLQKRRLLKKADAAKDRRARACRRTARPRAAARRGPLCEYDCRGDGVFMG